MKKMGSHKKEGNKNINKTEKIKIEKINNILKHVLKEVKPDENEIASANGISNNVMERLKEVSPKDVKIILAGSVARGTQIRGNSDIDIFLLFPKGVDERKMEMKGLGIAKKIVDKHAGETFIIKYAEHPYLQLLMKNPPIKVDIVPAFFIRDSFEMGSAVDRTQLHNEFVMEHLDVTHKDHVRLIKSFMKFHNIYGANAEIEGFSGYLCELLVYHFGSFTKVLQAFSEAKPRIYLNPKDRSDIKDAESIKRFNSNFVVIDPTDQNRNVAAGVSAESLARFIALSRKFLSNPSINLFYGVRYSDIDSKYKINSIRNALGADVYVLCFKVLEVSDDILWQQVKKFGKRITKILEENSFEPILKIENIYKEDAIIAFFMGRYELKSEIQNGPSVFLKEASDTFIKKHKYAYIDGERFVATKKSGYPSPKELFMDIAKNKNIAFPSYLKRKDTKLIINDIPENYAKMLYKKYIEKTNI
ncbi:CCA tRNA nucleotidyltransferase [Candidatus Marsarchaeota archaeon]|nr:CCA tRNA nucleotidyltransferase [Candidatus Marsarchaeota archaeon]